MRLTALAILISALATILVGAAATDYSMLRSRAAGLLAVSAPDAAETDRLFARLTPEGNFSDIDYHDSRRGSWAPALHWARLNRLADARSRLSATQLNRLADAVDFWNRTEFSWSDNFWHRTIGIPRAAADLLLKLGDRLPPRTVAGCRPIFSDCRLTEDSTGQNRAAIAGILVKYGLIYEDAESVRTGCRELLKKLETAEWEEGLQSDFSFHQHGAQLQFGNYGLEYWLLYTFYARLLAGSEFAFPPEPLDRLRRYWEEGLRWTLFRKRMDYSACGRQIAQGYPKVKYDEAMQGLQWLREAAEVQAGEPRGARYFYRSDYLVFRPDDWFFSCRMVSARTIGSEAVNRENLQCRFQALGCMFLLRSGDEYDRIMPLWDWRSLPGVTAPMDETPADRTFVNSSLLVGGVCDGRNAAAMMAVSDEEGFGARKSVFCFDDAVYFHGSRIRGTVPVRTTIDSRWYRGPIEAEFADGRRQSFTTGSRRLEQVLRVRHDGLTYFFPTPATVTLSVESRSGDWKTLFAEYPSRPVSGTVFTLQLDHGDRPAEAGYEYGIAPGREVPPVRFSAGRDSQTCERPDLDLRYVLFYRGGQTALSDGRMVSADRPAALLLRSDRIWLGDPLQKQNTVIRLAVGEISAEVRMPSGTAAGATVAVR